MWTKKDIFEDGTLSLTPQELIDFEHTLKDMIAEFLDFDSYSLFFPRQGNSNRNTHEPEFREETGELLLPLVFQGTLLGYFVARGVRLEAPSTAPAYIMRLASAALDKLALYRKSVSDPLTGLHTRDYFFHELEKAIGQVQGCLVNGSCRAGIEAREVDLTFSGTLGVIVLDLDCSQWINERYGYLTGDDIVSEVGRLLRTVCPKFVTASRFANDKFSILVPDAKPKACFQLAEVIRQGVSKLQFEDEVTGDLISITGSLGFVNYPQGLEGAQFRRSPAEQARILVRKAKKAVATAKSHGRNRVFGFGDILNVGGKVLEMLPMNRMAVSIGASAGARVGQRFLVRAPKSGRTAAAVITEDERITGRYPAIYKGEVVLVEVQDEMAFAEVLHLADPSMTIGPGDRLKLVSASDALYEPPAHEGGTPTRDHATGLFSYKDFLSQLASARQTPETFGLLLVRVLDQPREGAEGYQEAMDRMASEAASIARGALGETAIGGRYGLGGVIFLLPDTAPKTLLARAHEIQEQAKARHSLRVAAGAACYPFLTFDRADILENCRKALEHALLLPDPKVAVFDSISLNLSADRRFMDGDIYGAVDEFKLALLADDGNLLARNSLGICYAQLGRFEEARREFEKASLLDPSDVLALYNLGWANHRLGRFDKAVAAYIRCLKVDSGHIYSLMRLGSLAERDGDLDMAETYYTEAAGLPGGQDLVLRPLARVALSRGDKDRTREYLHLALNADHNDHQSMHMLARLYLHTGEDPQIAEILARQAAALAPEKNAYWDTLIQTLEAQDKHEEAAKVSARAR
ncbi:diguanylate cyclase domain-containing protein [Pseudodesulfovibrio tunisiensis]|uniref:diguanylate cyclase domain-containing protein n=1 Tax=Pseudodesulfovibrio tunisiensis TaxID=463192 RepID=UPI001FB1FF90|nr:diguanylate cyclase [Pseudodesulfovibrio tunisiensis]